MAGNTHHRRELTEREKLELDLRMAEVGVADAHAREVKACLALEAYDAKIELARKV